MNFNKIKKGDFLYFKYGSQTDYYIYINNIIDDNVNYDELKISYKKNEFIYSYKTTEKSLWNDKFFIFIRYEKCKEDIKILIEYIFKYKAVK